MIEVVPFGEEHVREARRLALLRRTKSVSLPDKEPPSALTDLPGSALIDDGRLAGFLAAFEVPDLRGHRSAYSPEWAHGTLEGYERRFGDLYRFVAGKWSDLGLASHVLTTFRDETFLAALQWQGFAAIVADGVRSLSPVVDANYEVVRAGIEHVGDLTRLLNALIDHLGESPVLLRYPYRTEAYWEKIIADPANVIPIAQVEGRIVAYLKLGPCADDVAWSVRSPETMSISGGYCEPSIRRLGVARSLLAHAVEVARVSGYRRLAVDWETNNVEATAFWTRHFDVAAVSVRRDLNAIC